MPHENETEPDRLTLIRQTKLRGYWQTSAITQVRSGLIEDMLVEQHMRDLAVVEADLGLDLTSAFRKRFEPNALAITPGLPTATEMTVNKDHLIGWQEYSLDIENHMAKVHDQQSFLPGAPERIFHLLVLAQGRPVPYQDLTEILKIKPSSLQTETSALRGYLPILTSPNHLVTLAKIGYRLSSCLPIDEKPA